MFCDVQPYRRLVAWRLYRWLSGLSLVLLLSLLGCTSQAPTPTPIPPTATPLPPRLFSDPQSTGTITLKAGDSHFLLTRYEDGWLPVQIAWSAQCEGTGDCTQNVLQPDGKGQSTNIFRAPQTPGKLVSVTVKATDQLGRTSELAYSFRVQTEPPTSTPTLPPTHTPSPTTLITLTPTPTLTGIIAAAVGGAAGTPTPCMAFRPRFRLGTGKIGGNAMIDSHQDCQKGLPAGETLLVGGTTSNIPPGHEVWLFVWPHAGVRYWMQSPNASIGAPVRIVGDRWLVSVGLGDKPTIRDSFDLVVVVANPQASAWLRETLIRWARQRTFPGLDDPDFPAEILAGIEEKHFITVDTKR